MPATSETVEEEIMKEVKVKPEDRMVVKEARKAAEDAEKKGKGFDVCSVSSDDSDEDAIIVIKKEEPPPKKNPVPRFSQDDLK